MVGNLTRSVFPYLKVFKYGKWIYCSVQSVSIKAHILILLHILTLFCIRLNQQPTSFHKYILPENDFVNCDGQVHDLLCPNGFSGVQVPAGESVSLPGYRDAKGCFWTIDNLFIDTWGRVRAEGWYWLLLLGLHV